MAKRNRAAIHVNAAAVAAGMLQPSQRHRGECFIDFIQVNIADFHAGAGKGAVGREQGFFEHDDRITRRNGQIHNPRARRQVVVFQRLFRHNQHSRCTIANLAGIGRRNRPAVLQQLDRSDAFGRRIIPDAFIEHVNFCALRGFDLYADNLFAKRTSLGSRFGAHVRFVSILVKVLTGEAVFLGDHFCANKLAKHDTRIGFLQTRAFVIAQALFHEQHRGRTHRNARHALNPAGQHNVLSTRHHALGRKLHGLLR